MKKKVWQWVALAVMALVVSMVIVFWKAIPLQVSIPALSIIYLNIGYCVGKLNLKLYWNYDREKRWHRFLYCFLWPISRLVDGFDSFLVPLPVNESSRYYKEQKEKINRYLFFMAIGGWWFKIIWNIFTTVCWCIIMLIRLLVLVIISPSKALCPCPKEGR
ncbi:MAG: hypothetical protein WC242_03780 [Candidatus Paceibacterota bacterium]|jgi:hypothetical protein